MLLFSQMGVQSMVYSRVTKATYWPICCYTTLLVTKEYVSVKKHTSSSLESFSKTASFFMGLFPDFVLGIMSPYLEVKVK